MQACCPWGSQGCQQTESVHQTLGTSNRLQDVFWIIFLQFSCQGRHSLWSKRIYDAACPALRVCLCRGGRALADQRRKNSVTQSSMASSSPCYNWCFIMVPIPGPIPNMFISCSSPEAISHNEWNIKFVWKHWPVTIFFLLSFSFHPRFLFSLFKAWHMAASSHQVANFLTTTRAWSRYPLQWNQTLGETQVLPALAPVAALAVIIHAVVWTILCIVMFH